MGENDIGTTEYRFAQFPENKPSKAWVDYNISQFPGYYTSEAKDENFQLMNFLSNDNNRVCVLKFNPSSYFLPGHFLFY